MKYNKRIEALGSTFCQAEIVSEDGRNVGFNLFLPLFDTASGWERAFKRAHRWADKRIEMLERLEAIPQSVGNR